MENFVLLILMLSILKNILKQFPITSAKVQAWLRI